MPDTDFINFKLGLGMILASGCSFEGAWSSSKHEHKPEVLDGNLYDS